MYRINRAYDIPPQMELPNGMYKVKPVNGNAAGIYPTQTVNGHSDVARGTLTEANRNNTSRAPAKVNNSSPRDKKQDAKQSAAKRKRSGSRSPPRNKSPVARKEQNQHKVGGRMANESVSGTGEDTARDELIARLEARQKVVIDKLLHLKNVLNKLGASSVATSGADGSSARTEVPSSVEVVVNADPANPPYSVVFLAKLLRETYGTAAVSLQSYQHSSCASKVCVNRNLFNKPLDVNSTAKKTIKISVIWKEVEDGEPELLVSPSVQAPVTGEANVARYLSRLLPSIYPIHYDSLAWDDIIRVDGALERAAAGLTNLNSLERQLKQHQPFLCGEATIADFVTFSAVVAYLQKHPKDRSTVPHVVKWLNTCQDFGGFRL